MMQKPDIIKGQAVSPELWQRARELRQQMTSAEKALWQHLRTNRLAGCHFRRQQVIGSTIVDFYCHAVGLVIEVDGPIHLQQKAQDAERDRYLESLELRVLRFTNEQVETDLVRLGVKNPTFTSAAAQPLKVPGESNHNLRDICAAGH